MSKTAIILGATGLTGGHLLKKLLNDDSYTQIKVFTRKPLKIESVKLIEIVCDLFQLENVKADFNGEVVFCCIGTTKKKTPNQMIYHKIDFGIPAKAAQLAKENGIKTFMVISAIGADAKSSLFYNKTKGEMENEVLRQAIENTYILRPSFISGNRDNKRVGEKIGVVLFKLINPLLIGRARKYRVIKAERIAEAMIQLAQNKPNEINIITSDRIQELADDKA